MSMQGNRTARVRELAEAADSTSNDKILRLFGRFIGAGYFFYILLLAGSFAETATVTASWWTPFAVFVIFGSGIGMGVASFLEDVRWTRRLAGLNAVGYLVVMVLWWPAWDGVTLSGQASTWTAAIPGVASLAAAAVWRPWVAFIHMFVGVLLAQIGNHALRNVPISTDLVPDLTFGWTFCAVFVGAAAMAFHTGRVLDSTIAQTHSAAASAAATQARSVERERLDALVHDTVLSTLLVAARQRESTTVTAQARRAIDGFDELRAGVRHEGDFDLAGVLAHMRSAASEVDEGVRFVSEVDPLVAEQMYPAHATRSIAAAVAEAMRNSVLHAGARASREVLVRIEPSRLAVVVADDGVGFDPDDVSELRLGLAVSIRGRMRAEPGGSATVSSRPGAGTTIELEWVAL